MDKEIKVSASVLSADFANLKGEIIRCERAGVDLLHLDVMDGHFVPNITIGQFLVKTIRKNTNLPLDTHLMIESPGLYIDEFIDCGSDSIYIHAECYGPRRKGHDLLGEYPKIIDEIDTVKIGKDLKKIRERRARAFVVINPDTPLCIEPILKDLDGVLIMSVNPGFANQKFMPSALPKIKALRDQGFQGDIAIDGGINATTAPEAVKAGANILATASYLFGAKDMAAAVQLLKSSKT